MEFGGPEDRALTLPQTGPYCQRPKPGALIPTYCPNDSDEIPQIVDSETGQAFIDWRRIGRIARRRTFPARLDGTLTNVNILNAVTRAKRQQEFEDGRYIVRQTVYGEQRCLNMGSVSRSWFTDRGRANLAYRMVKRREKLEVAAEEREQTVKLLTLTFRNVADSWQASNEVRRCLNLLRQWVRRAGGQVSYLWCAEVQKRGAIHYHVVLVGCPFIPKERIASWWPNGFIDIRCVPLERAASYVGKYISKGTASGGVNHLVRHVLHSASGLRHFGSSRDISKEPARWPAWVADIARENGGDGYIVEWWPAIHNGICSALGTDGKWTYAMEEAVTWRLVTVTVGSQIYCELIGVKPSN